MHIKASISTEHVDQVLINSTQTLAATVADDCIRLWDLETWEPLGRIRYPKMNVWRAAFTTDPNLLVIVDHHAETVSTWDVRSLARVNQVNLSDERVLWGLGSHPQETWLLGSSWEGLVKFDPRELHFEVLIKELRAFKTLLVGKNNGILVVPGSDVVEVWSLHSLQKLHTFEVRGVAWGAAASFSDDESLFYVVALEIIEDETWQGEELDRPSTSTTTLYGWNLHTGEQLRQVELAESSHSLAYWATTGEVLVGSITGSLQIFSRDLDFIDSVIVKRDGYPQGITVIQPHPTLPEVVLGTSGGVMVLSLEEQEAREETFQERTLTEVKEVPGANSPFAFDPSQPAYYTSESHSLVVRFPDEGPEIEMDARQTISSLDVLAAKNTLLYATQEAPAYLGLLDAKTLEFQSLTVYSVSGVVRAMMHQQRPLVYALMQNGQVLEFTTGDTESREITHLRRNLLTAQNFDFDRADRIAVVCGEFPTEVQVVSCLDGETLFKWADPATMGLISTVRFSPDRKQLAIGTFAGDLHLIDLDLGEVVGVFSEHTTVVSAVNFSEDGRYLLTGGEDCKVNIIELQSGLAVASYQGLDADVQWVGFKDPEHIMIFTSNNTLYLQQFEPVL